MAPQTRGRAVLPRPGPEPAHNKDENEDEDMSVTRSEQKLLDLRAAAIAAKLDPWIEIPDDTFPTAVDLRVVVDGRVMAAIRVRMEGWEWRYELPVRLWGRPAYSWWTRHLVPTSRPVTAEVLRPLDHYFGQIPGTGRPPTPYPPRVREDVPAWMRPNFH